jgi:rhodanese-related sulfurtransferase
MIQQVRPHQLADWLTASGHLGEALVLDVREPAELLAASVTASGFALLAIPMGSIPARIAELDPRRPIACLCHHGARSMQVAHYLAANGFEHIANITGGIDAWAVELDPRVARY